MTAAERLIATAEDQVGYMGKRSNAQLDDFKANAPGKYNKYARDLDALGDFYNGPKNGFDWCDVFVDWCFVHTFGREIAQKLLCQPDKSLGAGTKYSRDYYKSKGRLYGTPKPGDQIFFGDSSSIWHTGIVVKVEGGFVHTVEGNAGNPSAVRACRYVVGGRNIMGYGRPDWPLVPEDKPTDNLDGKDDDDMPTYKTLKDVPTSYQPTIRKLMEHGALKGVSDPDPNSLEDNVLNISLDYCRVMTTLDRLGKLD